jgi:N-acyl homoserine lactone hydrolase
MGRSSVIFGGKGALRGGLVVVLALSGCGLTVPLAPDRPELARFAPKPHAGREVSVTPLRMGSATAPRCIPAGEESCLSLTKIVHTSYFVRHADGAFLVDAGLGVDAEEDLQRFPPLARVAFEWKEESNLQWSLGRLGYPHFDFVLLTHAHWDHTSGLRDLFQPTVVMGPGELEFVRAFPADHAPTVMPDHLAGARLQTFAWDGPPYEDFPTSHDWFGDGAVVLVPLPGHTPGSIGVFLDHVRGRRLLFVGDAAWSLDAIDDPSHKLAPLSDLTDGDRATLSTTLWRLHHLRQRDPSLIVVPAHDANAFDAVSLLVQ